LEALDVRSDAGGELSPDTEQFDRRQPQTPEPDSAADQPPSSEPPPDDAQAAAEQESQVNLVA